MNTNGEKKFFFVGGAPPLVLSKTYFEDGQIVGFNGGLKYRLNPRNIIYTVQPMGEIRE
jgi:hypothetical protein